MFSILADTLRGLPHGRIHVRPTIGGAKALDFKRLEPDSASGLLETHRTGLGFEVAGKRDVRPATGKRGIREPGPRMGKHHARAGHDLRKGLRLVEHFHAAAAQDRGPGPQIATQIHADLWPDIHEALEQRIDPGEIKRRVNKKSRTVRQGDEGRLRLDGSEHTFAPHGAIAVDQRKGIDAAKVALERRGKRGRRRPPQPAQCK